MSTKTWFDAAAKPGSEVTGIKAVHAGGKGAQGSVIQPQTDSLDETPALILGIGPYDISAGSWERRKVELYVNVWIARNPIGASYAAAIDLLDAVETAYRAHAKAYLADSALQSLVLAHFDGITAREWPPQSNKWFLVLPWRGEAQVNRAAVYAPA